MNSYRSCTARREFRNPFDCAQDRLQPESNWSLASGFWSLPRRGTTLIELLLFIGILGLMSGVALPLLFTSSDNRLLQQTVSIVEQNGSQLLQYIGQYVRSSERILDPPAGQTGAVLTLQTESGSTMPTILGTESGTLVLIRRALKQDLSSPQVAIKDFVVRNTSVSSARPSVLIQFRVSRTIRLHAPRTYERTFEELFTLYPDDVLATQPCSCSAPQCLVGGGNYVWHVCEGSHCSLVQTPLHCP